MTDTKEDFLDIDSPIAGQNYVCLSFVSPEKTLKEKELFLFNKFMNQRCGELERKLDEIMEKTNDTLKNKIRSEIHNELQYQMKYTYEQFNDKFDDFKYKYTDELNKQFDKQCKFQTNVRGVKVRGVYSTYEEAERRAKVLQRKDRSFHVFVGSIGYWLPWDPCADRIENEEYLEDELNTLMKEYKENEIRKDLFFEDQKREAKQDAMRKKIDAENKAVEENTLEQGESNEQEIEQKLQEVDPWMKAKFNEATTTETDKTLVEEVSVDDTEKTL
jgi:hypothetical protein